MSVGRMPQQPQPDTLQSGVAAPEREPGLEPPSAPAVPLALAPPAAPGGGTFRRVQLRRLQRAVGNQAAQRYVQRDGAGLPPVPNYQLRPPSLQLPGHRHPSLFGGDAPQLRLDPQIEAELRAMQIRTALNPAVIQPQLGQLPIGPIRLPPPAPANPLTTPPASPQPQASLPPAQPRVGEQGEPPRAGTGGDILKALTERHEVAALLNQAGNHAVMQWQRLGLGGQVGLVTVSTLIAGGAIAGIAATPDARRFVFQQLSGTVLPVPGVSWLRAEFTVADDNLMFGLHLDMSRFLPAVLGIGPGSPEAMGGPPQLEDAPGAPTLRRSLDAVAQRQNGPHPSTVQRQVIQRDPPVGMSSAVAPMATVAPSPAEPAAAGLPPEAARQLLYATTTLRHVQPLAAGDIALLAQAVPGAPIFAQIQTRDRLRQSLSEATAELQRLRPEHGTPEPGGLLDRQISELTGRIEGLNAQIAELDTMIRAALGALNLADERALVALITERFPRLFIERGKQIAIAELDNNKRLIEAETRRYGLEMCVDPAERQALRRAAQDLHSFDARLAELQQQLDTARSGVDQPSAGVPDPETMSSSAYDVHHLTQRMSALSAQREERRQAAALAHPILGRSDIDLGVLANGSDAQLEELVGGRFQALLENIETTKGNVADETLKIWNLHNIVEMTSQSLGVEGNPMLQQVVNEQIQRERSDEAVLRIAVAALGITAMIVATVASGGVALVAGGIAAGAGIYNASESVQSYLAESAASNIAMDPQVADLSQQEPDLFWLVLDIAGAVLDVAQVVGIFNQLRQVARAAQATGEVAEFALQARRLLPGATADRVIASISRQRGVAEATTRTVEAIGAAFRRADILEIERRLTQAADAGFDGIFRNLTAQGRVRPLTREAVLEAYGAEHGAERIADGILSNDGLYDPIRGHLFIRPGHIDSVTATVVHEATHWLQRTQGAGLTTFLEEFQSFSMERRYLRNLMQQAGMQAVPSELLWMLGASEERIAAHILENYPQARLPSNLDGEAAVNDVLRRLQAIQGVY